METVQPNKKNYLVVGSVWKSASKTLRIHIKTKKAKTWTSLIYNAVTIKPIISVLTEKLSAAETVG